MQELLSFMQQCDVPVVMAGTDSPDEEILQAITRHDVHPYDAFYVDSDPIRIGRARRTHIATYAIARREDSSLMQHAGARYIVESPLDILAYVRAQIPS